MALEPDDSPAALNRDLRAWVKNWTGKGIGQVALGANISNSRAYAATANTNLVPRDLLLAIVRAAVPPTYDIEERTRWILRWSREWERRWELVEAAARDVPTESPDLQDEAKQAVALMTARPDRLHAIVRVTPDVALPAFRHVTDDTLRRIVSRHVYVAQDPLPVGYHQPRDISVYVDLHSASCNPQNREYLAQYLARAVQQTYGAGLDPHRTVVATPREGNVLLGSRVAELCGVRYLMVRTTRPPRFGFPVEGSYDEGSEAVIVDDMVMGSLVPRAAELLRTHTGLTVDRCFSIFARSDLNVREVHRDAGISLYAAFEIDDDLVATLRRLFDRQT